jgi:hypothetical protein
VTTARLFVPGTLVVPRYGARYGADSFVTMWKDPAPAWAPSSGGFIHAPGNPQVGEACYDDVGMVIALSQNEDDPYKLFVIFGEKIGWCMASELKPVGEDA